jgi:hypothetical protein
MDHVRLVEEVQTNEYLVESTHNKVLLEDSFLLHFLQSSQTHAQRSHDENIMFTISAPQFEWILELADVFPAWVRLGNAGQVSVDIKLLIMF